MLKASQRHTQNGIQTNAILLNFSDPNTSPKSNTLLSELTDCKRAARSNTALTDNENQYKECLKPTNKLEEKGPGVQTYQASSLYSPEQRGG
jgi:hypothetical protein